MSTTFGVYKLNEEIELDSNDCLFPEYDTENDFIEVAHRNRLGISWINELAPKLPGETKVYPLDNSAQGIYTIGDIKNEIENQ